MFHPAILLSLLVVLATELTVRRSRGSDSNWTLTQKLLDLGRVGFLYGLFLEAFKLI